MVCLRVYLKYIHFTAPRPLSSTAAGTKLHSKPYHSSEVCHPRCVFKLYGEVNSVKNTTINIWLNDGVY